MKPHGNGYRPEIDGLRAIAVLAVVLHHLAPEWLPGGYVGVDVFFVISGYLITGILRNEIAAGSFTFARFYERRARRIFPAAFAVLAVTVIAGYLVLLPSDLLGTVKGAIGTLLFSSNVVFWREMGKGYFAATDAGLNPLLHTWSLGVEEQFYVFFPLFLLVLSRRWRKGAVIALVFAAVASFGLSIALIQTKTVAVFFLSPFRAWELIAGALLAYEAVPPIRNAWLRDAVALAGLGAVFACCALYSPLTLFPGWAALAPVLGTAAVIHATSSGPGATLRMLSVRPVVYVGLISYSLYLWHWPLIVFTRYLDGLQPASTHFLPLLGGSLALAALSYHFIEQPFRRRGFLQWRTVFAGSLAGMALLAAASAPGWASNGSPGRFPQEVVDLDRARDPVIPFLECDGRLIARACQLGAKQAARTLVWGDSHALALAPVFDDALRRASASAMLATTSACPPFLLAARTAKEQACRDFNLGVRKFLQDHREIETVAIVSYWSYYSRELPVQDRLTREQLAAGLRETFDWLKAQGKRVVVFGPVPTYEANVPFVLARERVQGVTLQSADAATQRTLHRDALTALKAEASGVTLVDPIAWLCPGDCLRYAGGNSLYRDSNHLSVPGALYLERQVGAALGLDLGRAVNAPPN